MSFLARLYINDQQINVLYCEYSFRKTLDKSGKPFTIPRGGEIFLKVESTSNDDLLDWMISPTRTLSGKIVFYKRDNMSKLRELNFTDAYCIRFSEKYTHYTEQPMFIEATISAKEIEQGGSVFKNPWDAPEGAKPSYQVSNSSGASSSSSFSREQEINSTEGLQIENSSSLPIPETSSGVVSPVESKGPIQDWWQDVTNDTITDETKLGQIKGALVEQKRLLEEKKKKLQRWNQSDQDCFKKLFGRATDDDKKMISGRIDKQLKEVDSFLKDDNYKEKFFESDADNTYAHVYSGDSDHEIYLDKSFWTAPDTGYNSKAGTLVHEMSHFEDMGDTDDVEFGGKKTYGKEACLKLSKDPNNADLALKNADTFEYYVEESVCQ